VRAIHPPILTDRGLVARARAGQQQWLDVT